MICITTHIKNNGINTLEKVQLNTNSNFLVIEIYDYFRNNALFYNIFLAWPGKNYTINLDNLIKFVCIIFYNTWMFSY